MPVLRTPFRAALLVVSGVVGAVLVGQLPALGAVDHAATATPASAGQVLVCPGPAIAVGAVGTAAASLTATGRPTRVAGTTGGAKVTSTALHRGDVGGGGSVPRLLTAPAAAPSAGQLAAAQLETVTTGDVAGLIATACTQPASVQWLAAGSTATGRTSVVGLANASTVDAVVKVTVWTENGRAADGVEVVVPGHGRAAVSLAGLVQAAGGTVVRVAATGGLVSAALEQRTVRGLESGGVDVTGPTAAPALTQTLTGLRITGSAAVVAASRADGYADLVPVVRVLIPGSRSADVSIVVSGASGQGTTVDRRVAAGIVTDFALPGLADGVYTVRVTSKQPVLAGARASVVADASASSLPDDGTTSSDASAASGSTTASGGTDAGLVGGDEPVENDPTASTVVQSGPTSTARGIDLAWFAAGTALGARAAVAVVAGPSPQLTIANPTKQAATVRVTGATTASIAVPAGGTVTTDVAAGMLVLSGCNGLSAAVSYAGTGALAGYPVASGDQAAHPVSITH